MRYLDLNLHINDTVRILTQGQIKIKVKEYLPIRDKIDLVQISLQKAEQNGVYNEMLLDMYFNLYTVYMYTDLDFEDEKDRPELVYDELHSTGLLAKILSQIPQDEYASLVDYLETMRHSYNHYNQSAAGVMRLFTQDLPKNAEAASKILQNFNKEDYQNVIEFAQAANGNRPVPAKIEE